MASNITANQAPLIKAQVFSDIMLEQLHAGFLPDGLHRDVSDFGDGEVLYIPVMGDTVIRDYTEDSDIQFDATDSGQVSLSITEYVAGGQYVTDKLKQDGYKAAALEAQIPVAFLRKIKERYETNLLAQANKQTLSNPNTINGVDHRWVAQNITTKGVMTIDDVAYAKYAMDKADVPDEGRIAVVDPSFELALNAQVSTQAFINNPQWQGIAETGFGKAHRFIRNIYGFDIYISNRLAPVTETINGGPGGTSQSVTAGVANIFMCAIDDMTTPFMGAWRQQPVTEGFRNTTKKRDEYSVTARWGFGLQRPETLVVVLSDPTKWK